MNVGFLGAGRMAQALAKGFLAAGITTPDKMIASDQFIIPDMQKIGCKTTLDNSEVVEKSEVVILAVKPPVVPKVLQEVAPLVNVKKLMISIALGIPVAYLEQMLPRKTRVIRVMPNTPCLVRHGASVFSRGTSTLEEDGTTAKKLFSSVGMCEEAPEALLDAVTGLSGSGPAYMYIAIEALADGGVKMGIPRDLAIKLAAQTLLGSAKMVLETGRHPGALKDDVCSPAGSSIHAVFQLEKCGLRATLMEAVEAATLKSKKTGMKA